MPDYSNGAKNYSAKKVTSVIHLLHEYDLKSKGVNNLSADDGELLRELIYKIIHWFFVDRKIHVSVVSYLNAKPFVLGLQSEAVIKSTQLMLDHPAECARKLISKEVDNRLFAALAPVK